MSCSEREVIQSKVVQDAVVCPSCGAADQVDVWERIEATCNPERAAQLASGQIFVHTCSKCGTIVPLDYPLFYIDRDRHVAAFYPAGEGEPEELKRAFTQLVIKFRGVELSTLGKGEFEVRIAPERYGLVEKAAVWGAGLNDKVIEVLKASLLEELNSRYPERGFVDAQFNALVEREGGEKAIEVLLFDKDNTPGTGIQVPYAAYRTLANDVEVRTQFDKHRTPVVDAAWGREVLDAVKAAANSRGNRWTSRPCGASPLRHRRQKTCAMRPSGLSRRFLRCCKGATCCHVAAQHTEHREPDASVLPVSGSFLVGFC